MIYILLDTKLTQRKHIFHNVVAIGIVRWADL